MQILLAGGKPDNNELEVEWTETQKDTFFLLKRICPYKVETPFVLN